MGFYEHDNKDLYKENVLLIPWDKLNSHTTTITGVDNVTPSTPRNPDGTPTAINSGVAQVRCFIHPYCPFSKVAREEYDLVFNEISLPVINKILPEEAKNAFTVTPGVEGMHLSERYVYRHNYIVNKFVDVHNRDVYEPISQINNNDVNNTRYQEEQTWVAKKSVFDWFVDEQVAATDGSYFEERCKDVASWTYSYPSVTNDATFSDEFYDYKTDYYRKNSRFFDAENAGIDQSHVQFIRQSSATDCFGKGAHWRVEKKTPLFKGEDFFIDFKRFAKANATSDTSYKVLFDDSEEQYAAIDVFGDYWNSIQSSFTIPTEPDDPAPPLEIFINNAVRQSDDPENRVAFNFFNQAYYIIELGSPAQINTENRSIEHYFIIITERAYPIFVMIDEVEGFKYSKILSVFGQDEGGVHGSSLINADRFRIAVRNHLGKLVINFDINGRRQTPWVVTKERFEKLEDLVASAVAGGTSPVPAPVPTTIPITIPNATIQIWGGNVACGFCFGPLQYSLPAIAFAWPQSHQLPVDTKISARLTVSDEYIHDMARYRDAPGTPDSVVPLFTQQCHYYKQWGDSDVFDDLSDWKEGEFFFGAGGDPLIELSATSVSTGIEYPGIRDATIKLGRIGKIVEDEDRRRKRFTLAIGIESGSHLFDGTGGGLVKDWGGGVSERATFVSPSITATTTNMDDDIWVLGACKTPILTGIRLVAEENNEPRWDDGTGTAGYTGKPSEANGYFTDVSHHVLSYTEDWSANDFYELEHSGTVRFLLKPIVVDVNRQGTAFTFDDSQYLESLQDKSFYIEIWAGYEPLQDGLEYTQLGGFFKLMTGICHGGVINTTVARKEMTCQVKDYKTILKDQKFFNSPFFDGMRDVNAVHEIMQMAGFRSEGSHDPGRIIRTLKDDDFEGPPYYQTSDGRFFISNPYALPSSYRRIEQPYFKFDAGSTYYDGILKIAQSSSKLFYFDQHGIAHLESYMDLVMQGLLNEGKQFDIFTFTTNFYKHPGQLVFNQVERQYRQEDVHNHLKVISSTPNKELLIADDVRWESTDDPDVKGFLGYKKLFYQKEGMLGSEGAVKNLIDFYKVMFSPELYMKFETFGLPMRATDFITVDGQFLRTTKVSHNINAEKNLWWMNVEGERMDYVQ